MVGVQLCGKVREGFLEKVAFDQRHEEGTVWLCRDLGRAGFRWKEL